MPTPETTPSAGWLVSIIGAIATAFAYVYRTFSTKEQLARVEASLSKFATKDDQDAIKKNVDHLTDMVSTLHSNFADDNLTKKKFIEVGEKLDGFLRGLDAKGLIDKMAEINKGEVEHGGQQTEVN